MKKPIKCKTCRGKGKKRYPIDLPLLHYEEEGDGWGDRDGWGPFKHLLKRTTEVKECRSCRGSGYEGFFPLTIQGVVHQTELAAYVATESGNYWIAKSIIINRDILNQENLSGVKLLVPNWIKLITVEDRAKELEYKKWAEEVGEPHEDDFYDMEDHYFLQT